MIIGAMVVRLVMAKKRRYIPVSETGHTIGQDHHRSRLSDDDVEMMRVLYEEYEMGYRKIAWLMSQHLSEEVTWGYVRDVVTYRRRNGVCAGSRTVIEE